MKTLRIPSSFGRIPLNVVPVLLVGMLAISACSSQERTPPRQTDPLHAGYVGAEACRPCHLEAYETWETSAHGQAMAEPSPETVVGNFTSLDPIVFRGVSYRALRKDDSYFISIEADGKTETFSVDLLIGARQAQGYLTRMPDGRYQELPIAVNRNTGEWIEASAGGTLKDAAPANPNSWFYWKNPGRTWNLQCFNCHLSQMVQNYDPQADTYATAWVDLSINCESCHGPGEAHLDFWEASVEGEFRPPESDTTLVKLQGLPAERAVEACVQCHAKKTITALGFQPGDNLHDFYEPILLEDPNIWPDGLFRGEVYTYIGFLQNRCFLEGGLTCTHCHDSHGSAHGVDLITAEKESDRLCARCHPGIVSDPEPHTGHKPGTIGSRCIDCHMPQYELQEFLVEGVVLTDHRLASPVPDNTTRFGIPNACGSSGCHADKTAEWASDWSRKWYGDYQDSIVTRTDAIYRGRAGDAEALGPLADILSDPSQLDAVRASSATLLAALESPDAVPYLIRALEDNSTLIRSRAALGLGRVRSPTAAAALSRVLDDPNPFVRVNAVMAATALGMPPRSQDRKDAFTKTFNEYIGLLSGLWATDPSSPISLGDLEMGRGNIAEAKEAYTRGLSMWPYNANGHLGLAKARMKSGETDSAAASLKKALELRPNDPTALTLQNQIFSPTLKRLQQEVTLNPTSARAHHNLATLYAQQRRLDEAIAQYAEAIRLNPSYASAYRNMGIALANIGRTAEAAKALQSYLRVAPQATDSPAVRELIQRLRNSSP